MTKPALTVENLSKAYRIGLKEDIPDTITAAMTGWLKAPLRNWRRLRRLNTFDGNGRDEDDLFWALRDVSFEVAAGEVVGIIGRNGAGKSTLLKVLSRITEPTAGRVVIRGRVSSLLEVGTGFHPELTGRENLYMNGTILGMTKREIDRKFDEIVDFSGVETFLDTPIKRYSSGMKVRLAFAVAAHLEPEILIIDEVLAVGDAEFQKKCLGKMQDVAEGGRTVLFVSHNMAAVQQLCTRCLYLKGGRGIDDGLPETVICEYLSEVKLSNALNPADRRGLGEVRLLEAAVRSRDSGRVVRTGDDMRVSFALSRITAGLKCSFTIYDQHGNAVLYFRSADHAPGDGEMQNGFACLIPDCPLLPGRYRMNAILTDMHGVQDHAEYVCEFTVSSGPLRSRVINPTKYPTRIAVPHQWVVPRAT